MAFKRKSFKRPSYKRKSFRGRGRGKKYSTQPRRKTRAPLRIGYRM